MASYQRLFEEWIANQDLDALTWDKLKQASDASQISQQDFWRPKTGRNIATDDQMRTLGLLVDFDEFGTFHIAYLPWEFPDGTAGKSSWEKKDWGLLDKAIHDAVTVNPNRGSKVAFDGLTLKSHQIGFFARSGAKNCHFIGDVDSDLFSNSQMEGHLIDGSLSGRLNSLVNCKITGSYHFVSSRTYFEKCKINRVDASSSTNGPGCRLDILDCDISIFTMKGEVSRAYIERSNFHLMSMKDIAIGSFYISDSKIYLDIENSRISGRCVFENVDFTWSTLGRSSFRHSRFSDKTTFKNVNINFRQFADALIEAPIDIELDNRRIEEQFDIELDSVLEINDWKDREANRFDLERSCQILCDRHRQDGRKDLELRFRRLEVKSRAKRVDADRSTRALNLAYDYLSDFGASPWRPIRGLILIWLLFGSIYLLIGFFALGLSLDFRSQVDWNFVQDVGLLTADKTFPIGVSVDESELFGKRLVGSGGGFSAIIIGLLGAFQTILSGLMLFLVGFAIRNKLLIG